MSDQQRTAESVRQLRVSLAQVGGRPDAVVGGARDLDELSDRGLLPDYLAGRSAQGFLRYLIFGVSLVAVHL